jgi:hypothetical protein
VKVNWKVLYGDTHDYARGDIVRSGDHWGVVRRVVPGFRGFIVSWWTGQYASGYVEEWYDDGIHSERNVGAAFDHNYAGIPDPVLAKATYYKLVNDE